MERKFLLFFVNKNQIKDISLSKKPIAPRLALWLNTVSQRKKLFTVYSLVETYTLQQYLQIRYHFNIWNIGWDWNIWTISAGLCFITMLIWDIIEFRFCQNFVRLIRSGSWGWWHFVKLWLWWWLFVIPLITLLHTADYFIINHPLLQMFTTPHLPDNNMTLWYLNFIIMVFKLWPLWSLTIVSLVREQTNNNMKDDVNPI